MSATHETWKNPAIIDTLARRHYRNIPFHNYPHVLLATDIAIGIADVAIAHGVPIERDVLQTGGRYHDVGTDKIMGSAMRLLFPTTEEYAADVSGRELRLLSMPEPLIQLNGDIIKSTSASVPCATNTARCLRQGDLIAGGILATPVVFLNGTLRLFKEKLLLRDEPIPPYTSDEFTTGFIEFGSASHEVMSVYAAEDVSVGDHQRDEDGRSLFNLAIAQNVDLLLPENMEKMLTLHLDEIVTYRPAGV